MNRIESLFAKKKEGLLNVYFTAGYPQLEDTVPIMKALEAAGADLIEIGMPFSDPVADGPTIQASNQVALDNGMSIELLLSQLSEMRAHVSIPVILMGYLNPIMQYGIERFCNAAEQCGVDGLILPDLPMDEYQAFYKAHFEAAGLLNISLITPQTSDERIRLIDQQSNGFIYMVSSAGITGAKTGISDAQTAYFDRINQLSLSTPRLIGFGISDRSSFATACEYASGAIVGSAFINLLRESEDFLSTIPPFIHSLKATQSS
ncbi:MAG: tryptophan synthase subunit alpha [Cyclobacteriaceae bacterium]